MRKQPICILLITLLFYGCNNDPSKKSNKFEPPVIKKDTVKRDALVLPAPPDILRETSVLSHYLKRLETPSQKLVTTAKEPSVVKGMKGTIIKVVPKDLVTEENQPVVDDITVELKELTTEEAMIKENAPTVSDCRLLVSGGAYYINMTSGGQQVKLKIGKTLKVNFPKQTDKDMALFYGQRDSSGQMNWLPSSEKFVAFKADAGSDAFERSMRQARQSGNVNVRPYDRIFADSPKTDKPREIKMSVLAFKRAMLFGRDTTANISVGLDTISVKRPRYDSLAERIYNEIAVQNMGWINCDRFLNAPVTTLAYNFDVKDSITCAMTYLIFKDINSILENRYVYVQPGYFPNVPIGTKATIVALAVKKGRAYTCRSEVMIAKGGSITLPMRATADKDVSSLFKTGA